MLLFVLYCMVTFEAQIEQVLVNKSLRSFIAQRHNFNNCNICSIETFVQNCYQEY